MNILTRRSEEILKGVHPDLIRVIRLASQLSPVDFIITEGLRTPARQQELVRAGKSQTLNSRHLTGHAVDLAPWVNNTIPWQDWQAFSRVAQAMKQAASALSVPIVWGGDWKHFKDGPHFELNRTNYP
ncbi:M15 family metallopeptidase [Salmonella enterica]|uniref:M15 family peptidase n=1 Tax=Salmonella enterica subsp. salamae TaxID=59202 RepID=A0A5Y3XDF4_SALER|nr:M15 family metallopeptidase [Salmonella enterica]ECJ4508636.1 M15 family peptidase [Salmonella enterica subsp. salamae]EDW5003900.1 M15 family metallopeptidase [Salmonella enterica subsp. enterica serovar Isangi]EAX4766232.1 M15 family metallopeptidase [Salmonella enterica]EGT0616957.1 M15 family metallopeptidase [Salmonella enterica]EHF9645972.1 M15 family metallopeptidase [Salmonella enterica]